MLDAVALIVFAILYAVAVSLLFCFVIIPLIVTIAEKLSPSSKDKETK